MVFVVSNALFLVQPFCPARSEEVSIQQVPAQQARPQETWRQGGTGPGRRSWQGWSTGRWRGL